MDKRLAFLLVDDDSDDVFLFEDVLREADPAALLKTAGNGQEALDLLRNGGALPDVVFLDLNMPRMGGKECLSEMKADPHLMHLPVLIYTTSSQAKDVEDALHRGALGFITKPSSMKDLKLILAVVSAGLPANLHSGLKELLSEHQHLEIVV